MSGLEDMARQVLGREMKKGAGYEGLYDNVMAFVHAVAWKDEPWLQALLGGHVVLWLLALGTRRMASVQAVVFCFAAACVFSAERLNAYGHEHWREFATQDYFDANGVFAGVVFALPLILLMLFQMLNSLYLTSHLLVDVKRIELKDAIAAKHAREGKKDK